MTPNETRKLLLKTAALCIVSGVTSYMVLKIIAQFFIAMLNSFVNHGTTLDFLLALVTALALGWLFLYAFVKTVQNL